MIPHCVWFNKYQILYKLCNNYLYNFIVMYLIDGLNFWELKYYTFTSKLEYHVLC